MVYTCSLVSCELLSKLSILDTSNNGVDLVEAELNVVNCFQNLVS